MKMVSYWKKVELVHCDEGMFFIIGWYDHKNEHQGGEKALGVHWGDYPQSRGVLSPCVIPDSTRNAILSGLLHQAVMKGRSDEIARITSAVRFFVD